MNYQNIKEKIKQMPPSRIIVLSFILVILLGTALLCLPFSTKSGYLNPLDALFTATSATCVTGLSLFDTYSSFTFFGQGVILLLIQIGGLGLATFATAATLFLRKKLGYKNLLVLSEMSGTNSLDMVSLLKAIMVITFSCEFIGSALLAIRFVPEYGALGLWSAVFVSVSAFCNAGFDILGFIPGNSSVTAFAGDQLVSFTISGLVFMGSLGFLVVQDIFVSKLQRLVKRKPVSKLTFYSQICLRISAILVGVGALLFFIFEYNNTLEGMNILDKITTSIFQSVNTRTAGFASVNIAEEYEITRILTMVLMFIGGSPGSTAGGIKITTFLVIMSTVVSTMRGKEDPMFLGHRFIKKTVFKAITIAFLSAVLIIIDVVIITYFNNPGESINVVFESVSAFGTVGLSAGVTSELNIVGKIVVIITMFIGRVGPASLGIAIMIKPKKNATSILPEAKMLIG